MSSLRTGLPWRRPLALLAAVGYGLLGGAAGASAAPGDLVLVADTGEQDYGEVDQIQHRPAISADGRFVAFVSQGGGDGDPLFLRDMTQPSAVAIVTPSDPRWPGFDSATPVLSDSGRYLAFASEEKLLSGEDVDGSRGPGGLIRDVFRYDRLTGKMTLVSRRSGHSGEPSRDNSDLPSISADGRFVAYGTESSNLAPGKRLVVGGIYRRDLATEANQLISGAPGIDFWRPGSYTPDISGDGKRVAFVFQYSRTPFDPKDPNVGRWLRERHKQIMLWDARWKAPKLVSRASGRRGAISNQHCSRPSASGSGGFVAFVSKTANLAPGDRNGVEDVYVRDVKRNVTTLVSRVGSGGRVGDAASNWPSISADGRYVAFLSEAGNLVPEDGGDDPDVYVKDLRTGRLTLVPRGLGGEPSNGRFGAPAITPDGRYVAFGSTASNISPEVTKHNFSFYRYQLR
jgi:Tol biopolymer transport system component